jgi:membrane associated rhomboid family serine protease
MLRLRYNSPVVLTFSLLATGVTLLSAIFGRGVLGYFTAPGHADWTNLLFYVRLFTHVLGHQGWEHLLANLAIILLLGPLLEEKCGAGELLEMIAITAVVTAVANVMLFDTGLRGASGVAFMMILLASAGSLKRGEIPLTFLLVAAIFLGREVYAALWKDQVSQFAHLAGGACGAAFGFLRGK